MIKLFENGAWLIRGTEIIPEADAAKVSSVCGKSADKDEDRKGTIAYSILKAHNTSDDMSHLRIRFDAMTSHDITFVGIIQTAKASGMEKFPIPYVLTNCHNSLCAVGGTINEDDHVFGLSAAKKYGGIYVPPHLAVIHQYMRETMAGCGKMILGSDSHTRYGALGTMAVGEGGGELVKQLLRDTYDVAYPGVVAIYLDGKPSPGVGPQDIALAIIGAVFKNGYVKNKVMEFVGPGVASMTTDYRNGIDVMTTETTCLSSIWQTDEETEDYLVQHGRGEEYRELKPADVAYYDGLVYVDLSTVKPMIALPFHPSNTYEIDELLANPGDILREVEKSAAALTENTSVDFHLTDKVVDGRLMVEQGIIAGCAGGGYTNLMEAARILKGRSIGNGAFTLAVYPSSQPVFMDLVQKGAISTLMAAGSTVKTAFCGPCFGAGDTPANNALSIRHATRNFPNREGSKPGAGQLSAVALMDARSIAATAANGGVLTSAEQYADLLAKSSDELAQGGSRYTPGADFGTRAAGTQNAGTQVAGASAAGVPSADTQAAGALSAGASVDIKSGGGHQVAEYHYDDSAYRARVYQGFEKASPDESLVYGPNIKDWPEMEPLADHILLRVCSRIMDKVTTTDELIPSGETSSYRSNPLGLAEFTLSRRDPAYVGRAKEVDRLERIRLSSGMAAAAERDETLAAALAKVREIAPDADPESIEIGSMIYCVKPGDGSAREQAASCQRVLGGLANICSEYATKRYRSNVMNWGMLPFQMEGEPDFSVGDYIYVPDVKKALEGDMKNIQAYVIRAGEQEVAKADNDSIKDRFAMGAVQEISLYIADMTDNEKEIVKAGCLINFNRNRMKLKK
ncbi:MAG: hydratase [Lachnospiraceae bacterium]|nr:hydratase [Lachnospiraceae bacterium]